MMETYRGQVRTPADAIKLFEACRLGLLPRVQRRLSEKERQSITSGSVFVWDEREAGMRRWTDGKSWSASRVAGSFLTYREMEGKRGGGNYVPTQQRRLGGKTPDSGRGSDEDADMDGEGPDGYRYKPDGLLKQSFSITTSNGQHLHLISYFARPHSNSGELPQPTTDPALRGINPVKGMYPESTIHEQAQGPAVTRSPMPGAYLSSPHQMGPGPSQPSRGPYPYQVAPPGYNWPPSPGSTPPYSHPQIYPAALAPQPAPNGHANSHYSPHQHGHGLPPVGGAPYPPPIFDRPPPALQDPGSHAPPLRALGGVAPGYSSPRLSQSRLMAEQQALEAQRAQQRPAQSGPSIDPRIAATAEAALGKVSEAVGGPKSYVASSLSQNIPSISSLVHAEDTGPGAPGVNGESKHPPPAKDSPSHKLEGPAEGGRPQDIPHAKLGFGGEDMRALRVLDRKFCI